VAFDENLTHYKQQIPALFCFNTLLIASNGTESKNFFRIVIVRRG
jgi:type I restriction enzyme R subunit